MAVQIGSLLISLGLESGAFKSGLNNAEKDLRRATKRIEAVGASMQDVGQRLSLAVTVPVAAFGAMSVKVASDAAELRSSFNQTFGAMSDGMADWAEATGDAMGRSTQEMQRAANTFGLFFNQAAPTKQAAAEMSKSFSVLAQDLASFFNTDTQTAIDKLRSGLSGESEPLRDFGVFLSEAAVSAKALEMGLVSTGGEVSEQNKIMARYQLILEATKNAQGDVARTSGGFANRLRATRAQFEELQVSVGEKLLPVMTRLLGALDSALGAFNRLSPGAQTAALALAGIAAALGPVLIGLGAIVSATAPFTAAMGLIAGSGGLLAALSAGFSGLVAALAPVAVPLAALAAAGALIYANWGAIAPVLAEFGAALQQAIGPQVSQAIADVSATLAELWNGPLGEGLRGAMTQLAALAISLTKALGPPVIALLGLAAKAFGGLVTVVTSAVQVVSRLLQGDLAGAAEAAFRVFNSVFLGIPELVGRMVTAVRGWLIDKLGAVWKTVTDRIETVKLAFFNLYDAVVGNSYVPDMVDGIAAEMARLEGVMVRPALAATAKTKEAFRQLAQDVAPILDRLFPEAADKRRADAEFGTIERARDAGLIGRDTAGAALDRLQTEGLDASRAARGDGVPAAIAGWDAPLRAVAVSFEQVTAAVGATIPSLGQWSGAFDGLTDGLATLREDLARSFTDIILGAESFGDALRGVFNRLTAKILDNLFDNLLGNLLGGIIPGFATGTSFAPGGLALVGEKGPELVELPRGSRVHTNAETGRMMRQQGTVHSPTFVFPGITDARQAREAAGQAARRYRSEMQGPLGRIG